MSSSRSSMSILVVEDEALLRWTVRRQLEDKGYMVLDAPSCAAALDIAGKTRFDLLVSDYRLEDGFGDDLARRLGMGRDVALILMTGEAETVDVGRIDGVELVGVLSKPLKFDELLHLIQSRADEGSVSGEKRVDYIGGFKVLRIESEADLAQLQAVDSEFVALDILPGSPISKEILKKALAESCALGSRICVIGAADDVVSGVCSEAGVEIVTDREHLEVLARRLLSAGERDAVLSAAVLRDE
jgi:DNA-binding response OmpR family regulator